MGHCLPLTDPKNQWSYCPSIPAAAVFALLFCCTFLLHIYQAIRHRKAFCWVIIMGALWETGAFAIRILSARNPTHKGSYDASFLLILLAPLSINAFDYMVLGRLTQAFLPENKIFGIKGTWMGKMFVCFDIISFVVQIGGGLLSLSHTAKTAKLGLHVVTGGLVFQQALIAFFIAMTIRYSMKLKRSLLLTSKSSGPGRMVHVLQASLALISYRIIFRLVQFCTSQGSSLHNYLEHHEFFVYVFDALPMFIALVLINIWHPGKVLKDTKSAKDFVYAPPAYPPTTLPTSSGREHQYQMDRY